MCETEWSRSRFWLGHFLYSRHDRHPITWKHDPPPRVELREPLKAWLRDRSQEFDETGRVCGTDTCARTPCRHNVLANLSVSRSARQVHKRFFGVVEIVRT